MPLPTLDVEMQRGGWYMGDSVASILGTTTALSYSTFSDITAYLRRLTIRRGRQHELDRMEAGTATVVLRNPDGRFDPTRADGAYAPDVRPMVRFRIKATWGAITYPLYYGYVEAWGQSFTRGPAGDSWVEVRLTDAFKPLNLDTVTLSRGAELTGARVTAVLDAADWPPAERNIDTGQSTLQAQEITEQAPLGYLQQVADSEYGPLFIAADGRVTFYDRSRLVTGTLDTSNDTWGDYGVEKDYEDVTLAYDDSSIWNRIIIQAPDKTDQIAEDTGSQGKYFRRVLSRSTLLDDENEMLDRATYLSIRYSAPAIRVVALDLEPRGDDTQWPRILGHDLHDKIRVIKRPPGGGVVVQDSFLEGINHEITAVGWRATWSLSPLDNLTDYWVLDDPVAGVLDSTTRLYM